MAASTNGSEVSDGPVLNLMNKRLRALRKKYNRILQLEESIAQGKKINKEQEEVLHSKISVVVLIDEYEKLRAPLASAVQEEVNLATQHLKVSSSSSDRSSGVNGVKAKKGGGDALETVNGSHRVDEKEAAVEDLVEIMYFGNLFDVKTQSDFTSMMLTKTHERSCCLTYDYVTDDATDLLGEKDLDLISTMGSLLISKPVQSGDSHKNALRSCVERAKLWISNSDQPIADGETVTYAGLRERLNKILASDYLTTTPEMKAPVEVVAAAGSYDGPVPSEVHDITEEASVENHDQKEEEIAVQEAVVEQSSHVEVAKDESQEVPNKVDVTSAHQDQNWSQDVVGDQNQGDVDSDGFIPVGRSNRNQRASRVNNGGGRRDSYGRGGRGSRGGGGYQNGRQYYDQPGNQNGRSQYYDRPGNQNGRSQQYYDRPGNQNGRSQYYDQPGTNYPNNYSNRRGRGDRGGGNGGRGQAYNNRGSAGQNGHAPADVQS